jgi:hypothetical protein
MATAPFGAPQLAMGGAPRGFRYCEHAMYADVDVKRAIERDADP